MLMLGIYDKPNGTLLLDATPFISDDLTHSTNSHGDETLTCTIIRPLPDAFRLYSAGLLHVVLWYGVTPIWVGRWERPGLVLGQTTGNKLTAHGYWTGTSDEPYTALWSSSKYGGWEPVPTTLLSNRTPDRYIIDQNNRLFIGLKKNAVYGAAGAGSPNIGSVRYRIPSSSVTAIAALAFDYTIAAPANFGLAIYAVDASYTGFTLLGNIVSSGSPLTSSTSFTMVGATYIQFDFYLQSGTATNTGEDGDFYARITNLRIKATTSAALYADEIAKALVAYARIDNPTQLAASTALIQSPGVDLTDELYEDQYPSAILTRLAGLHQWETGVDRQRQLYFRPRGSAGQQWFVDLTGLQLERAFDTLNNSAYGLYQDANSRKLRTAVVSDAASVLASGITRRQAVAAPTTSAATAGTFRDTSLSDTKNPLPAASFVFDKVYHANGTPVPLFVVQANDTITARNLPPALGSAIDRLRTFRISRTEHHVKTRTLRVEPESPLKNLDVLVARRSLV